MITLAEIQHARNKLALEGYVPWNGTSPQSWAQYDWCQVSFATELFGMAPEIFKLYGDLGEDLIAFEVDKSGVSISTTRPNALHEIAHWVEMSDPNRWLLPNWGIPSKSLSSKGKFGKFDLIPTFKITPAGTIAALSREVRVLAIEANMRLFIPNRDVEPSRMREGVSRWGEEHFIGNLVELPFGKFKDRQDIRNWVSHIWQTTFDAWDLDRIEFEFKKRIEMVRGFMETREELEST